MKTMNSRSKTNGQSRETLRTCRKVNRNLTETQQVSPLFQTHFVDVASDAFGMRGLIRLILKTNGAIWREGINTPSDRAAAIAASMYTEDITAQARIRFTAGSTRYPRSSLMACLGQEMLKRGEVGRIQLSGEEDSKRPKACSRPRCKWYLAGN